MLTQKEQIAFQNGYIAGKMSKGYLKVSEHDEFYRKSKYTSNIAELLLFNIEPEITVSERVEYGDW